MKGRKPQNMCQIKSLLGDNTTAEELVTALRNALEERGK